MPLELPPLPTPHGDKIAALAANEKLPPEDRERVRDAQATYESWRSECLSSSGTPEVVTDRLVTLLQEYKRYIDLDLIFDSPKDWLYRQKGRGDTTPLVRCPP